MPCDLSKEAMTVYFRTILERFDSLKREERAREGNNLLSYILTYFNHFIQNFGQSAKFINVIHRKCIEFISDETVAINYPYLMETSLSLKEKLEEFKRGQYDEHRRKEILNYFKAKLAAQKAAQVGMVG